MNKAANKHIKPHRALSSFLVGILCILLASCNYFQSEQAKLQKATKLYDEGKFNESIVLAKNILQSDSKSCDARILLGLNQFAKFSLVDAQDSFKKAKNQDCKDVRLFGFWVKTLLYRNMLAEANALYTAPYFASEINQPENILLEGDIFFLQNNYEKAKETYARYFNSTHNEAVDCLSQTKLLAMQKNFEGVVQKSTSCDSLLKVDGTFLLDQNRYLRAIAQINLKNDHEAISTLNTILDDYHNQNDPYIKVQSSLLLMKLYMNEKEVDKAAIMADALLNYVALPDIYHAKGLKAEHDKKYDIAEQQFLMALKLNPKYEPSLLELANIKYKEGNIEQAKYYTGKVDALAGNSTFTDRLDEMLAIKYLQEGDLDAIINTLPNDKNSGSEKSKFILALAYAKKGDKDNAWKTFHAIEGNIAEVEKKELLKARLYIELGDNNSAEDIYKKYIHTGNPDAILGLSQLYIQEKKYDVAEKLLTDSSLKAEEKYRATILLVELYSLTNQKQKIFNLLDQSIKSTPKNQFYQLTLAKIYYKYAMYQEAIDLCDKLIEAGVADSYIIKANSYIRLGKLNEAKQVFNLLIQKDNNNAYAYIMLAYIAAKESNFDLALTNIDKSLAINPKNINAIYTKIELLLAKKLNKEALDFAKSSASLINEKQTSDLILGFAYSKIGDAKNAYLNYRKAQEDGNQDIRLAFQTYSLSVEVNGKSKANDELDQWLGKYQSDENLFYVADYFMSRHENDLAEKYYKLYIARNQSNPAVYNNLAWLMVDQEKNNEALSYANKALSLAPHSPEIMDTVGFVLLKVGEYDKAGSYLLSASQKLNNNPSVKYHLALFYYHKQDYDKSRSILQDIENTKFAEQSDAKKLLAEVSNKK